VLVIPGPTMVAKTSIAESPRIVPHCIDAAAVVSVLAVTMKYLVRLSPRKRPILLT
jgi:hypothetical protein